jgi:iron complex outermembrane receptor protein
MRHVVQVQARQRWLIAALCATALTPVAAQAQAQSAGYNSSQASSVEEVVVTAQKRSQPLQDVPLAVSAVTENELRQMGGAELRDVSAAIPGLEVQSNRAGENLTTVRGVAEIGGGAPSVGVYIDEIPISTFSGEQVNLKTFDVERLEVLRGPQGTLYGEGSLGGTIRIVTNKPDAAGFAGAVSATGSSTSRGGANGEVNAMVNLPVVTDKIALRAVGMWSDQSGWIDNPLLGQEGINSETSFTGRLSARVTPTDNLTIDGTYIHQEVKSDGPNQGDEDYQHFAGTAEPRDDTFDLYNLTINYHTPIAVLTSATGYFDRDSLSHNDFTSIAPLLSFLFGAPINAAGISRPNNQKIFTQEVRLVSVDTDPVAWTVGAFYKHDDLLIGNSAFTEPSLPVSIFDLSVDEKSTQKAVFGEADWAVTGKLHAVAGVRYFDEDRTTNSTIAGLLPLVLAGVPANSLEVHSSVSKVTPKFSVYYKAAPGVLLYATASGGFRAGGINPYAFLFPGAPQAFEPETLWNYEAGAKTSWLNDRLILNAAAFHIKWDNVIVNAVTGNPLFAYSVNAGQAHSNGAEVELTAIPVPGLQLRLTGDYTDAVIDEAAPGVAATPGAKLPFTPQFKVFASAQYSFPLTTALSGRVRLDAAHTGKTYSAIDNSPAGVNHAYDTFNARIGLNSDRWEVTAFVNNLGNTRGELSFTGVDIAGLPESALIRPRTVGINLAAHF